MTTTSTIKIDLETLPAHMRGLRLDERGYPVPWFVGWIDGKPDFRCMDGAKLRAAVKQRLCWVCGQPLGRWLAFPIGPMCSITRTISEPPSHRDCAEWSIRNCPFLSKPDFVRDLTNIPADAREGAGFGIKRNPGVTCLWITREYEFFDDGRGGVLFTVGKPENVTWWRESRAATRAEVEASVESGMPILFDAARRDGRFAVEQLERQVVAARALFPAEATTT
jgi:hypothetical protein